MRRSLLPLLLLTLSARGEAPGDPKPPGTTPLAGGTVVMSQVSYLEVRYGVDLPRLRKLKGMPVTGRGTWALQQIAAGRVASSFQVKALVDTSAARRRSILEGLLRQDWPGGEFALTLPEVGDFLDYSGRLLNVGDRFEYRCEPERLWVRYQHEPWRVFRSRPLREAVLRFNTRVVPANEAAMAAFEKALDEALN